MRLNRRAVGAATAATVVLVGGGSALAATSGGERGARCDVRLAKVAERRGVTVEQLTADVRARLLARIDAAEKAGRISSERATKLRQRVTEASLCGAAARAHARPRLLVRGTMLHAAARFLGLDAKQLRAQLPGTSLAALAGGRASALEAAMVAPAKARLAKAVANGRVTQARADAVLDRLEVAAHRLANHVFPKK